MLPTIPDLGRVVENSISYTAIMGARNTINNRVAAVARVWSDIRLFMVS